MDDGQRQRLDAFVRGDVDAGSVQDAIDEFGRSQVIDAIGRATSERYREVLDKLALL